MTRLSYWIRLRHLLIVSRWQRWLFPTLCIIPYVSILIWMLSRGLIWVYSNLPCSAAHGGGACALDSLAGKAEFRTHLRKR